MFSERIVLEIPIHMSLEQLARYCKVSPESTAVNVNE